jgi:hypothetical protein
MLPIASEEDESWEGEYFGESDPLQAALTWIKNKDGR